MFLASNARSTNRPADLSNRPADLSNRPADLPNRPADLSNRPADLSNRPADLQIDQLRWSNNCNPAATLGLEIALKCTREDQ